MNDKLENNNLLNKIFNKYFRNYKFNCSIDDVFEILNFTIYLFTDYIYSCGLYVQEPKFHTSIKNELFELIKIQLEEDKNFNNINDKNFNNINDNDILLCIDIIEIFIFKFLIPKRSYKNNVITYKKSLHKIFNLKKQLDYLKNVYQPEQRTDEWYLFRHNVITASNIWKAFQTEKSFNQLVLEKCKPIDINKYNYVNEQSPMHWGQKYEFVSVQYYQYKYNTLVDEFGCIPHKDYKFLAASPDGINTKEDSLLYGRMLEIKNIFNRVINGIPKFEYWIQMQIQMEVCNLNECDFLETRFLEYENQQEFLDDYYVDIDISGNFKNNIMMTKDYKFKGMIVAFLKDNKPFYAYSPFACSYDELILWELDILILYKDLEWFKNIYYRLDEISCVLVLRNKNWFNFALPIIEDLWQNITELKNNAELLNNFKEKNINNNTYKSTKTNISKDKKCLINRNLFVEN